jgi:hypothetical protein
MSGDTGIVDSTDRAELFQTLSKADVDSGGPRQLRAPDK